MTSVLSERKFIKKSTLLDIDKALFDWFDKVVNLHIEDANKKPKKVTLLWAGGERWRMVKNKKNLRDSKNALILPLISIRRLDFENVQDTWALGRFQKSISYSKVLNPVTSKRANLFQQRKMNNKVVRPEVPVYEMIEIPYPVFVKVKFEISLWAQYQIDLNIMLEEIWSVRDDSAAGTNQIQLSSDSGNKYILLVDPNTANASNIEDFSETERVIKSTIPMTVLGYLVGEGDKRGIEKSVPCVSEIKMTDDRLITDPAELEKIFGK